MNKVFNHQNKRKKKVILLYVSDNDTWPTARKGKEFWFSLALFSVNAMFSTASQPRAPGDGGSASANQLGSRECGSPDGPPLTLHTSPENGGGGKGMRVLKQRRGGQKERSHGGGELIIFSCYLTPYDP